jgi:YHS domain-containing protein
MTKLSWRMTLLFLGLAGFTLALLNYSGLLAQQSAKPPVFTEFRSNLALDGHDPVAYFKTGKPAKGSAEHALTWNGATWHFSSAENKAAFEAKPEAYAPQYGGYCAWAVSEGYTAKGDPSHWRIVDGKLYLNYDHSVQRNWEKDVPGRIAKGDKNWPAVLK